MSESNVAKGSCLCGAVELSTSSLSPKIGGCHCGMCRKWGGGAFMGVECSGELNFAGEENVEVYQSSEWAERGFCKKCGTHLFYLLKSHQLYFLPVGIFDDQTSFKFESQFFLEDKPEYYEFANQTKNLSGEELFAMFAPPSD